METICKSAWMEFRDRKVLFLRSKGNGVFYTPGGKRKEGETDIEALVREIREEVGVALIHQSVKHLSTFTDEADGKPLGTLVEIKCFTAQGAGEISPASEIEEVAWFSSADGERTTPTGRIILTWLKEEGLID